MACEGADRQADFPCSAWHGREPIQKGFFYLKTKGGGGVTLDANTGVCGAVCVCVQVGKHQGKKANASVQAHIFPARSTLWP